ncbi:hypothetical protein [Tsukamurella columbiensis]|uniref:Peptidase M41 domain-containing protein n=1 Tax=Tsukamurella columbiensis TaxID=128509 RepID=A0ABX1LJ47_9ACTN|nr:hypothetical protein [Tsukamurella columbiensis]NMD58321.1 hypothetical protein [Tsukamurella columbiensis]
MRAPQWLTVKVVVVFGGALLAYTLWFNGMGVAVWTVLRAMTQTPHDFTVGVFVIAVMWLVLRVVNVLLPRRSWTAEAGHLGAVVGPALPARPLPADRRREFAEHEAAHIVASVARGVEVSKVTVRRHFPPPGSQLGGWVENSPQLNLTTPGMTTPEKWFDQMVILLAGRAYDDAYDRDPFGSISDYDQSHAIADMLRRYRLVPASGADEILDRAAGEARAIVEAHLELIGRIGELVYAATTESDTVPDAELQRIVEVVTLARSGGERMPG